MSKSPRESRRVAGSPPNPPPTTTTRCRGVVLMRLVPSSRHGVLLCFDEPAHGIYERQVGEGLREVPQMFPGLSVDLLGVELEGPGEVQELLAELARPLVLADHAERGDEPERAD